MVKNKQKEFTNVDIARYIASLPKGKSIWLDAFERFKKNKFALFCLFLLIGYIFIAILSITGMFQYVFIALNNILGFFGFKDVIPKELLYLYDWNAPVKLTYSKCTLDALFGTDSLGRSILRKVLLGAGISILVGSITAITSAIIGTFLGVLGGYIGGIVDEIVVWLYTTINSVPYLLLLMALAFVLGKGLIAVCFALGLTNWVNIARLVRAEVIRHKERDYVYGAKAIGAGHIRIIFRHILPNIFPIILINLTLRFVGAIRAEVILTFLGIGVQNLPSWGFMIAEAKGDILSGWWNQFIVTTIAIFIVLLSFNVVADTLRDAWDPRLKGSR